MKEINSENSNDLHRIADLTRECSVLEAKAKKYSQTIIDFGEAAEEGARKCRRLQNELLEANERADLAEKALLDMRKKRTL